MKILVTGGAGYIGSHTVLELVRHGHQVVVVDNLSNSSREAIVRVEELTSATIPLFVADVRDAAALERVFAEHAIDAVIHFAGLKAVGESVAEPLLYYENNLGSTLALLRVMGRHHVRTLVFSSSACVYGAPNETPVRETAEKLPLNPYGRTKLMIEDLLEDISKTSDGWSITSLRYFNPVGADASGRIGEDPNGIPNNLFPYVSQVASGRRAEVQIFGNDFDTVDGTGVRDYIHVTDLARAHLAALTQSERPGVYKVYNLSTGRGYSVLELIRAYEQASGKKIPYTIVARRPGDTDTLYGDPTLALHELGWRAKLSLEQACVDGWRWQSANPQGYAA